MKMKRLIKASMLLMVAALFAACANEDIAQDKKKENETEAPKGGVVFATNDTKISAKRRFIDEDEFAGAKTRTLITHTPNNGADAVWTSTDAIWVKAVDGTWKRSTAITLHDGGTSAEFTLPGSKADYADGCEVRYTGNGGLYDGYDNFRIPHSQPQTVRNDFSRAPDWGDCGSGTARATGNPDKFNFTLKHLASYLCFLPRCENTALAPNIVLRKISISAQSAVSGGNPFLTDGRNFTSDGKHIEAGPYIYTSQANSSAELPVSDFAIPTTRADAIQSACYAVIIPGTYNFTITYTIYDPTTNVTATIEDKVNNVPCGEGVINDITASLAPKINYFDKFYMWDAQQNYWWGHLKDDGTPDYDYPKNNTDPRWHNESFPGQGIRNDAQTSLFKMLPNVNEMCWYLTRGDLHWDIYNTEVMTQNGHLEMVSMGGLWIKKKAAILRDNSDVTASRFSTSFPDHIWGVDRDWRSEVNLSFVNPSINNIPHGKPANITDYFFLPALGYIYGANHINIGKQLNYWSSSATPYPNQHAFTFVCDASHASVMGVVTLLNRTMGFCAKAFE